MLGPGLLCVELVVAILLVVVGCAVIEEELHAFLLSGNQVASFEIGGAESTLLVRERGKLELFVLE